MNSRGDSFDHVAEKYAAARPGYPAELFDFVIRSCALRTSSRLLEIGVGTGQATRDFAARGFKILGLEPGAALAATARRLLGGYPDVSLEEARFETWEPAGRRFDLLFSAQAFHWIDPTVGLAKPASVLVKGGCLALFWNVPVPTPARLTEALSRAYARHAPQLAMHTESAAARGVREVVQRFADDSRYEAVAQRAFPWSQEYAADQYIQLLGTYSDHLALAESSRSALFTEIHTAIAEGGGRIEKSYEATCFIFRLDPACH